MNDKAITASDGRTDALLRAVGFDRLSEPQRELALSIADRYQLDPLLKHLVMIEGRAYITRDGLLHIAHRSGQLDGIETTEPAVIDNFWRASCSVYRKDMSRPFTYTGRYPTSGGNQKFAPEMAVKVAEVMALRRAFDVAAPTAEERWDAPAEDVPSASASVPTLAERAAAKAAEVSHTSTAEEASDEAPLAAQEAESGLDEPPAEAPAEAGVLPGTPAAAVPLGRLVFLEELHKAGIKPEAAVERAAALFPDVAPKDLTDEQRGQLFAELSGALTPAELAAL